MFLEWYKLTVLPVSENFLIQNTVISDIWGVNQPTSSHKYTAQNKYECTRLFAIFDVLN